MKKYGNNWYKHNDFVVNPFDRITDQFNEAVDEAEIVAAEESELGLQPKTTQGAHLKDELDDLNQSFRTAKPEPVIDEDALIP